MAQVTFTALTDAYLYIDGRGYGKDDIDPIYNDTAQTVALEYKGSFLLGPTGFAQITNGVTGSAFASYAALKAFVSANFSNPGSQASGPGFSGNAADLTGGPAPKSTLPNDTLYTTSSLPAANLTGNIAKARQASDTVYTADTQTLTNKTINAGVNTLSAIPITSLLASDTQVFDPTIYVLKSDYDAVVARIPENLVKYSEQLNNIGQWVNNGVTLTPNAANDLSGYGTLEQITYSGGYGNIQGYGIAVTPGVQYTFSIEMKRGTNTEDYIVIKNNTTDADIASRNVYSELNTTNPVRVSITFTVPAGLSIIKINLTTFNSSGTLFAGRAMLNRGASVKQYWPSTDQLVGA